MILIAGDAKYYEPLKTTIKSIRKHFPNVPVVIYDLGLSNFMREPVIKLFLQLKYC